MANWEETPGPTQEQLEGLYLLADMGMPQNSPGSAGGNCSGKGLLGNPVKPVASATWTLISGMKMDGWMDG